MDLTRKQTIAIDLLEDRKTRELYFGGGAGGGKSGLGSHWLIKNSLLYPGTRWLMGRSELKTLKETTLLTFFDIAKKHRLVANYHFQYGEKAGLIQWYNGSQVVLKDLFNYPADPHFDSLGSLEISGGFIDEAPQVVEKAKNIVLSRIRYRLKEYCHVCGDQAKKEILETDEQGEPILWRCGKGHRSRGLIPKLLMTGNPSKNWPYHQFYLASKDGTIREDRAFIQALATDNKYIPAEYIQTLESLDKNSRERLLKGNWEYDDDPAALMEYTRILQIFRNDHVPPGERWITADIARFGKDSTVIVLWYGWRAKIFRYHGLKTTEVVELIRELQILHGVPSTRVIADEDGVGGGVVDQLGCLGFVNNATPMAGENFTNLKSQCYFKLAERINGGGVLVQVEDTTTRQLIVEELEQVKQDKVDQDRKKAVVPKEKVKEALGRSPDYADALMMREYGEFIGIPEQFII